MLISVRPSVIVSFLIEALLAHKGIQNGGSFFTNGFYCSFAHHQSYHITNRSFNLGRVSALKSHSEIDNVEGGGPRLTLLQVFFLEAQCYWLG